MAVFNVLAAGGFSYYNFFDNFDDPNSFFRAYPGIAPTHTALQFTLKSFGGGPNIVVNGAGFIYDADGNVIDGTISSLQLKVGGTVLAEYNGLSFDAGDFQSIVDSATAQQSGFEFRQMFVSPAMDITGSAGDDDLRSGNGNDTINLGAGFDYIEVGGGDDSINGGNDYDVISYHWNGGFRGININLATGIILDQFGGTDTIANVEEIEGTFFNDRTTGTTGDDYFRSLSEGRDRYNGTGTFGSDFDYVDFNQEQGNQGIVVDLASGSAFDTFGFRDILNDIEEIGGTQFDDSFIGNDEDNWFDVRDGSDTVDGGAGDFDTVSYGYANTGTGIIADLAAGTVIDPWGKTDQVSNIEEINGSQNDDQMAGDGNNNRFRGNQGADSYDGRGGFDRVLFHNENGSNGLVVNLNTGVGTDTFGNAESFTDIEGIRGSKRADSIVGNTEDNWFQGLAGKDTMRGGAGVDEVNYGNDEFRGGAGAVNVDLGAGTATDGFGNKDTLATIEDVFATRFGDTIIGSSVANRLSGQEGSDTLTGGGAADIFAIEQGQLGAGNVDTIADYNVTADTIELDQAMFSQIAAGTLAGTAFRKAAGADPLATTAAHRIIYSSGNGNIWYDPDGNGVATKVLIATLTGSPDGLTAADFEIFV